MLKGGPDAQRGPDIQRAPDAQSFSAFLLFWWARFLGRPRWSEGPRLSERVFFGGFPHRFRDFFVGFGCRRRSFGPGTENPKGALLPPLPLAYVPGPMGGELSKREGVLFHWWAVQFKAK